MAFSFFHRILCDTPKKSKGKNLTIVALQQQIKVALTSRDAQVLGENLGGLRITLVRECAMIISKGGLQNEWGHYVNS